MDRVTFSRPMAAMIATCCVLSGLIVGFALGALVLHLRWTYDSKSSITKTKEPPTVPTAAMYQTSPMTPQQIGFLPSLYASTPGDTYKGKGSPVWEPSRSPVVVRQESGDADARELAPKATHTTRHLPQARTGRPPVSQPIDPSSSMEFVAISTPDSLRKVSKWRLRSSVANQAEHLETRHSRWPDVDRQSHASSEQTAADNCSRQPHPARLSRQRSGPIPQLQSQADRPAGALRRTSSLVSTTAEDASGEQGPDSSTMLDACSLPVTSHAGPRPKAPETSASVLENSEHYRSRDVAYRPLRISRPAAAHLRCIAVQHLPASPTRGEARQAGRAPPEHNAPNVDHTSCLSSVQEGPGLRPQPQDDRRHRLFASTDAATGCSIDLDRQTAATARRDSTPNDLHHQKGKRTASPVSVSFAGTTFTLAQPDSAPPRTSIGGEVAEPSHVPPSRLSIDYSAGPSRLGRHLMSVGSFAEFLQQQQDAQQRRRCLPHRDIPAACSDHEHTSVALPVTSLA
ncbi:unnamed protein product [Parajaminaea phylloscopi]